MTINATLINYLHLCHRKLWLHAHVIRMEHTSDIVSEGKLIGEESYPQRAEKNQEVELSATFEGIELSAKIDFFNSKLGVVHETKKSAARELAHIAQVQFYLYLLRRNEIVANYGTIEYPKLKQTDRVDLNEDDVKEMELKIKRTYDITQQENCPTALPKSKCTNCSYFEFCWSGDEY
jgi:CRISPR-associated exonuclease Cas4